MNCPFYCDDSDYGPSCYHGVELRRLKKEDEIHIRYGVGGCVSSSLPKKCPLLTGAITTIISEVYNEYKTK